jgi:hypothetical protein
LASEEIHATMRRADKLRKAGANLQGSHTDHPGLDNVATAFRKHRKSIEDRIAPAHDKDTSWLTPGSS